jgi:hypothetical protein
VAVAALCDVGGWRYNAPWGNRKGMAAFCGGSPTVLRRRNLGRCSGLICENEETMSNLELPVKLREQLKKVADDIHVMKRQRTLNEFDFGKIADFVPHPIPLVISVQQLLGAIERQHANLAALAGPDMDDAHLARHLGMERPRATTKELGEMWIAGDLVEYKEMCQEYSRRLDYANRHYARHGR